MYFADFRANFYVFLTIILFCWLKWVLKKPLLLEQIYDNNWLVLLVKIIFLLSEIFLFTCGILKQFFFIYFR